MAVNDYWLECVQIAADECGATLTKEQADYIAGSVESGHENYGLAHYSPPASDGYARQDREWKAKYDALQKEFDAFRNNAETAVKQALGQRSDAVVQIGEYGEVRKIDGRMDRIQ